MGRLGLWDKQHVLYLLTSSKAYLLAASVVHHVVHGFTSAELDIV
jgi:hypothetical protein